MALTFIGETDFVQSGQPQWTQNQWELDTLEIPFSGAQPGLEAFLSSLSFGDASLIDPNMWLTNWRVGGSKYYPEVALIYSGKRDGILPPLQHKSYDAVQSATTATSCAIWPNVATTPATVQYYAPTKEITAWSLTDTTTEEPVDPPLVTSIITWSITGAEQPAFSIPGMAQWILTCAYVQAIIETQNAEEFVAGQFWRITKRKTRVLLPYAPGGIGSSGTLGTLLLSATGTVS